MSLRETGSERMNRSSAREPPLGEPPRDPGLPGAHPHDRGPPPPRAGTAPPPPPRHRVRGWSLRAGRPRVRRRGARPRRAEAPPVGPSKRLPAPRRRERDPAALSRRRLPVGPGELRPRAHARPRRRPAGSPARPRARRLLRLHGPERRPQRKSFRREAPRAASASAAPPPPTASGSGRCRSTSTCTRPRSGPGAPKPPGFASSSGATISLPGRPSSSSWATTPGGTTFSRRPSSGAGSSIPWRPLYALTERILLPRVLEDGVPGSSCVFFVVEAA